MLGVSTQIAAGVVLRILASLGLRVRGDRYPLFASAQLGLTSAGHKTQAASLPLLTLALRFSFDYRKLSGCEGEGSQVNRQRQSVYKYVPNVFTNFALLSTRMVVDYSPLLVCRDDNILVHTQLGTVAAD